MADKPIRYNGKGFSLRGEKNRLALPASLRKDVVASSAGERVLCLDSFDDYLDREEERATRLGNDFDRDAMSMVLYGYEEVPFDASGRFVLGDDLAEVGNLRDEVFFHGAGDFFTVWSPDELYAMGPQLDLAKASCRRFQADADKGRKK